MAHNYTDITGTLIFDGEPNVTPLLSALFDWTDMDLSYPGKGKAYIKCCDEDNAISWDSLGETLCEYAEAQGITNYADAEGYDLKELLEAIAAHHGLSGEQLTAVGSGLDFDASVDLLELFDLAKVINDGHNLIGIALMGGYHCSKPRLWEFGGFGGYRGRAFEMNTGSYTAIEAGDTIDSLLTNSDLDGAGEALYRQVDRLLAGVVDPVQARQLRRQIADRLLSQEA